MKRFTISFLTLFSVFSLAFAHNSSGFVLGSVDDMFHGIQKQNVRTASIFSIKIDAAQTVNININSYYAANGQLSTTGSVQGTKNSLFILKGDHTSLYGYVAIHDNQKAYEYTTVNGKVVVNEVPIAKIFPCEYDKMVIPPMEPQNAHAFASPGQFDYSPMALHQLPFIGTYQNEDVRTLQSKPNSPKVLYLDITGVMNGDTPQTISKEEMFKMWEAVSAFYSMYDINVTTDPSIYNSVPVSNSGVMQFNPGTDRPNAPISVFGTSTPGTMYIDYQPNILPRWAAAGWTCSHECGHVMGMLHDGGGSGGEYFEGLPAFEWCPIMGNYWYGRTWQDGLYQWSKGEYNTASNQENDLQIMLGDGLSYRPDDIPTTKAIAITNGSTVDPLTNYGQIEKNTDSDTWTFSLASNGHLTLDFNRIELLGLLDLDVTLLDANGQQKAHSNNAVNRSASLDLDLAAGSYKLVIKGGAEGTPSNGFSNYSSMGFYGMQGTITENTTGINTLTQENSINIFPNPAKDITYLTIPDNMKVTRIRLTSLVGETVFQSPVRVNSINLSSVPKGMYLLKIETGNETVIRKVAKL